LGNILGLDNKCSFSYYLVNLGNQYFVTDYDINKRLTPMVKGHSFFWPKQVIKLSFCFGEELSRIFLNQNSNISFLKSTSNLHMNHKQTWKII